MTDEVMDRLANVIRTHFDLPELRVTRETTADQVAGWDSIAHAVLLMDIEMEFDFQFSPEDVLDLDKVGDLLDVILRKVG